MPEHPDDAALAVVTGANRGLGLEVSRQLAQGGWRVLLTARDPARAAQAAADLMSALHVDHAGEARDRITAAQLDVCDPQSVARLGARLKSRGERIGALVNNAGVYLPGHTAAVVRATLAVNYWGAARVTDALLPLLTARSCVVMVSSGGGELAGLPKALRARLEAPGLDRAALEALLAEYLPAAERGDLRSWPRSAYGAYNVSKAALNALTRILARKLGPHGPRINAVCPGWVRTEMGGVAAPRSVQAGAQGIVWAATLPTDGPTGGFFRDGEPIPW